jgi:nucleoside-diphosphate kinase
MSALQETLILIKPDGLETGLVGEILRRFEQAGFRVRDIHRVRATSARLRAHYADLRAKNAGAFERNLRYLSGKEVVAVRLSGVNAIAKARLIIGPTDPSTAPPGTLRGDLSSDSITVADGEDRGLFNLVHASDSPAAARREIRLWFGRTGP